MEHLIKRQIAAVARARSTTTPVLLLEGPRGVGKSTLLAGLASGTDSVVIDLDREDYRQLAQTSPATLAGADAPVLIDEYQRAPGLLDAIKARLNTETAPGMFVLAGSSSFDSLPRGTQALTGRLQRLAVMPFTQAEIDGMGSDFIARAFEGEIAHSVHPAAATRQDYIQRVMRGGMPLALAQSSDAARSRWFAAYVAQSIDRDAGELRRIGRRSDLRDVLTRVVGQTASVLNVSKVASDVAPSWDTTSDYIELLESLFLVQRLPAWGTTLLPRSIESPKIHVVDSGVGGHLLRLSAAKVARLDPAALTEYGHLLESFVVQDAIRQTTWMDEPVSAGYWRTRDNVEVDLVLERADGMVIAIEVKAGEQVKRSQLSPLVALRDRLGSSFAAGIAFHTGNVGYEADDRIHALPIERLWT
ncbi:ATP-binding protein [Demequina capsici]|uniref:ATP-binding protein n=1 Tax=Demequina capsici TaxID=3075620 RepID=A0AA96JAT3_9MICO|nr:ATP-binding protein [Demequina sp. PMTSA13]WNM27690.1 ATP-binding protein [Demequina sp. PMTSA13]